VPPEASPTAACKAITLNIRWDWLAGAESYDLEFLHVSDYDAISIATPDFTRATRINTPNQNYTLNLAYDDGFILYRVRGVGYDCGSDFRKEGVWSTASTPVAVNDIDQYRNWQYVAVYAEDGKRKEVISFYDGTGKQRQAVTLSNTENTALVGETMYDYEGRPSIQTLPAPEERRSSQLCYYESFSLVDGTSDPYTRKVFDTDDLFNTGTCTFGVVPGMDDAQGASNYYSPNNDAVNTGMYQALPDAQLYPFVQTVYGPDGRPAKQSAPGADHNMGSGHEVESYYTTPTQERIDRLFGNEVGYAEHYNQVSVVDPNGQMSVSYLDLSGRVIATSLVGESPANMDELASNTVNPLTESFNANNIFDPSTGTWMVNAFYMVNTAGEYSFTYEMTPEEYINLCTDDSFGCVYDLEINIYDGCDNPMDDDEMVHVLGTPYVITYAASYTFTKTFTVTFPGPGVYRIEKKLSLNQAALDAAILAFQVALPGTCFQTLDEIRDSLNGAIDSTECQGCDSSCIVKGLALGLEGETLAEFIDSCQTHDCTGNEMEIGNCESMLEVFAGDLSPGGQYFDNVPAGTPGVPDNGWLVVYAWPDADATSWTEAGFLDPSGTLINSWAEMRMYWQTGWATRAFTTTVTVTSGTYNSLVEFHPEYCHYTWCTGMEDSREFDMEFFAHDEYTWANTTPAGAGNEWIYNPGGANEEGYNMIQADPYFNTSPGSGDYANMLIDINTYTGATSMWDYAGTLAGCTSCDDQWILFRSLYVSKKAEYMRARENSLCGFLCDDDEPMDFYANACSGAETEDFMIRIPDVVGVLATQPTSDWNTNSQTLVPCNTAAVTNMIDIADAPGGGFGSHMEGCIEVMVGGIDITCGTACLNGTYTAEEVAAIIVAAINSCVSMPYDFTAAIDVADPSQFYVMAPAWVGDDVNNVDLSINFLDEDPWEDFKFNGGITGEGTGCLEAQHCFCRELLLYTQFYNATNDSSSFGGNYIVDHSVYTTVEAYIAYVLNASYGTSLIDTDVEEWMDNCTESEMADPTDGGTAPLAEGLDCENPIIPCMEDAYDITDYYANVFYQQLIQQATQNFIAEYIAHCFDGAYSEDFDVVHEDREYHYTLYYYDQAGNLTRTVPPHATDVLDNTETTQVNAYRTAGTGSPEYPNHARLGNNLVTNYKYNSFNNLVQSETPDGGQTNYFYDVIGRIVASQNAKQAAMTDYVYSYTFYDAQGRVYEVGQVTSTTVISTSVTATMIAFNTYVAAGTREQVTSTYYDESLNGTISGEFYAGQNYLRKRVTTVTIEQTFDNDPDTYDHATHFSYDVHGNVNELIQEFPELVDHGQQYKHISYEYDIISGNVNQVIYQQTKGDQFIHRYYYDADNRLTNVCTSTDSLIWEQDAKYFYYLHGPLGRSETGDVKVQGTDYAYTIHGWIKGVNANMLDATKDLGKDAQATNSTAYTTRAGMHSNVGQDAYGYVLGYYWDARKDYKPINAAAQSLYSNADDLSEPADDLFNGNIKEMSTALMQPNGSGLPTAVPLIYNQYRYDQLNRITQQISYTGASTTDYNALSSSGDYTNLFVYDAAGNIQKQFRNGESGAGQSMDSLTYHYYTSGGGNYKANADGSVPVTGTNKLNFVDDNGTSANYDDDLEDQAAANYTYDQIGNLITDASEDIDAIEWNVYGKIQSITRDGASTKSDLEFIYDAFGNRIVKIVKPRTGSGLKDQDEWMYTYYMRDAAGSTMNTYTRTYTEVGIDVVDKLQLTETHLYGASRLGMKDRESEAIFSDVTRTYSTVSVGKEYIVTGVTATTAMVVPDVDTPERTLGHKQYEFSNYLGNVLVTLSDRKFAKQQGMSVNVDYFTADIRSYTDYAAFGVRLAGRNGGSYRYGFNGQEKEPEIAEGIYTAEFWQYDSRLGRRWNIDPRPNTSVSVYAAFENSPIFYSDPNGDTVRYAGFRSRVNTALAWVFNKDFRKKFEVWNNEEKITLIEYKRTSDNKLTDADRKDETYDIDPGNCQLMYHYVNYSKGFRYRDITNKAVRVGAFVLTSPFYIGWKVGKAIAGLGYGLVAGIHNLFTGDDKDWGWGWANRVSTPDGNHNILSWGIGDYNNYNMFGQELSGSAFGGAKIKPRNGLFGWRIEHDPNRSPNFIDIFEEIQHKGYAYHYHINWASDQFRDRFLRGEKIINLKY